jgi:hypothetical protein
VSEGIPDPGPTTDIPLPIIPLEIDDIVKVLLDVIQEPNTTELEDPVNISDAPDKYCRGEILYVPVPPVPEMKPTILVPPDILGPFNVCPMIIEPWDTLVTKRVFSDIFQEASNETRLDKVKFPVELEVGKVDNSYVPVP